MPLPDSVKAEILAWLKLGLEPELREELETLIRSNAVSELADAFNGTIEFGTGGMRGPMGVGTNRLNSVMIARATQGLADYMHEWLDSSGTMVQASAVISYDSRRNSLRFSRQTASTLAANGIKVYLFKALRPTPELSFAVRHLGALAGVMITASHNPKEDNGYKAYWADGGQVVPPHDKAIVDRIGKVKPEDVHSMSFEEAVSRNMIVEVGTEIDEAFLAAVLKQRINADLVQKMAPQMNIVYSALHGTGGTVVPEALRRWGFTNIYTTPSQQEPNGEFPTVKLANPEVPNAFDESIAVAREKNADIALATDPDCDRVGVAVRTAAGDYVIPNGNQVGALLVYYLLTERKRKGELPEHSSVIKTIVTTDFITLICRHFNVTVENVLTGFKWIADKIHEYETHPRNGEPLMHFIFGCEESVGYLAGTHARDKDAVVTSCLIAEMAAWAKAQSKTLLDLLDEMSAIFGLFSDSQISIYRTGVQGQADIKALMNALRQNPPAQLLDEDVTTVIDVANDTVTNRQTGELISKANLPSSNVLVWRTAKGTQVVARPSGTEPKIKFYFSSCDLDNLPIANAEEYRNRKAALALRHEQLRADFARKIHEMMGW